MPDSPSPSRRRRKTPSEPTSSGYPVSAPGAAKAGHAPRTPRPSAGRLRRVDLALARSGKWVILDTHGDESTCRFTGQVDPALAALDLESWRKSRTLSPVAQVWVADALRIRCALSQRRMKHGGPHLSTGDILGLLMAQDYRCAVTGRKLEPGSDPWKPSIDRIDNAKGYAADNIRIVCYVVNMALNTWGLDPVLEMAALLVAPI